MSCLLRLGVSIWVVGKGLASSCIKMKMRKVKYVILLFVTILGIASLSCRLGFRAHNCYAKKLRRRYLINGTAATLHNDGRDRVVFYNRVGKCGSRSLWDVANFIKQKNEFRLLNLKSFVDEMSLHPKNIISQLVTIASYQPPLLYIHHIYFLDFKSAGLRSPYYINMIRDPIDRFSSHYNYLKYGDVVGEVDGGSQSKLPDINTCVLDEVYPCNSEMMFYMRDYFCGYNCQAKYGSGAVAAAKRNIDDYYVFVGLLEEFEATLLILEVVLPGYFKGAMDAWEEINEQNKEVYVTTRKEGLTEEAKDKLRCKLLKDEYDVYTHVKGKFHEMKKKYLVERS